MRNKITSLIEIFKNRNIQIGFFTVLMFFIVSLYSGYALTNSPKLRTYFSVLLVAFSFTLLIYLIFTTQVERTSNKKDLIFKILKKIFINTSGIYLLVSILIVTILTFVAGSIQSSSLFTIIHIISLYLCAFAFTKIFDFNVVIGVFRKVFYIICLISLFFYILIVVFDFSLPFLRFQTPYTDYDNFGFIYFRIDQNSTRNCSIFWEPALFSIFLCLGLISEFIFSNEKIKYERVIVYLLCGFSTFSIIGLIGIYVAIFISIIMMSKKAIDKNFWFCVIIALVFAMIFVAVFIINPNLFQKLTVNGRSGSLTTRLYGMLINFRIFADHPFGVGAVNESKIFFEYAKEISNGSIDSQTCTFGFWFSAYGIFGIFLLIFPLSIFLMFKKIKIIPKILIILLALFFMIAEPLENNLFFIILLFYITGTYHDSGLVTYTDPTNLKSAIFSNTKTSIVAKNSIGSFLVKGLSMLISLFTTSAYISYFNDPKGDGMLSIWFTILSILTWILVFDIGIGHGLKNKLIQCYEDNDKIKAKKYISSSYLATSLLALCIFLFLTTLIWTTDVFSVFNVSEGLVDNTVFRLSLTIIVLAISLNFVLKIVSNIFESLQKQGIANIFAVANTLTLLLFVLFFKFDSNNSRMLGISIAYLIGSTIPLFIGSLYLFSTKLKEMRPSFRDFSWNDSKAVMSLGGLFFVIQICMLLVNSTNTFVIQQLYGASGGGQTAQYTYYHKIFNIVIVFSQLLSGPLWAIIAKAKSTKDYNYVKKANKFVVRLSIFFAIIDMAIFGLLPIIFAIWIPNADFAFSWIADLFFAINGIVVCATVLFTAISNGLSKLKYQIIGFLVGLSVKMIYTIIIVVLINGGSKIPWYYIELGTTIAYLPVLILVIIGNSRIALEEKNV